MTGAIGLGTWSHRRQAHLEEVYRGKISGGPTVEPQRVPIFQGWKATEEVPSKESEKECREVDDRLGLCIFGKPGQKGF